jgi:hypothetical protein
VLSLPALVSCGLSPAEPELEAYLAPAAPLNGLYDAAFHTRYIGPVHARVIAQPTEDQSFKANTRPGVAWNLVGGFSGAVAPLLAPFLFPSGMILTWSGPVPALNPARTGYVPSEGTIGVGTLASLRLRAKMLSPSGPVAVYLRDNRLLGLLTLEPVPTPVNAPPGPSTDYAALVRALRRELPAMLYDPALRTPALEKYFTDLDASAPAAQDDVEFLFTTAAAWRAAFGASSNNRFSLPLMYRAPEPERADALVASSGIAERIMPIRVTHDKSANIATIRVDAFTDAASVDRALDEALRLNPAGIILDLRTCPGVDASSLRMLARLIDRPVEIGTYVNAARRADVAPEMTDAPRATVSSASSVRELQSLLDREGWASVRVEPAREGLVTGAYSGPLVVLTSRRTASSCEPLVRALQQTGRAKVIGEPTAGRPFLSSERDLGQGWVLRVSAFDLVPPDGRPLSSDPAKRAIAPDIRAGREEADRVALDVLTGKR